MSDPTQILDACPLLAGLPAQARQTLARLARSRRFSAEDVIYLPGAMQSQLSIVAAGRVRLCSSNASGREATLAILDVGAWFGDTVFSPGMPRVFGATAHDDCQLVDIPGEALLAVMADNPEAYPVALDLISRRLWAAMSIIQDDVLRGTEARLGQRLLFLAQMHNSQGNAGSSVSFRLTRELLANMMGMTRQGVHRALKNIEGQGLVEFAYGRVTIPDTERLQAYIDQQR
ncbi:cAMP-binding domain of CRP or a regulatory subunit of cAMP-dependent protein kinases [Microbulbifer donghaiensis]|uniref:cAMP-binding domain of CRP or a regulatory subunit of cAMP-dependent protein kinases n=1 Tax=Microbulbifer donghaiensis TaxID=494016 RepID=A0A1M4Z7L9_9GAMM|nr:Crp/Fnr family transcriptional regulator [Microbulbifer donghaiensis]SHF13787.1 cAMP-binding domain of CRP or a regulatory subunit of cAMP-dependent protein kinases [Microbulbifer donghaiensis]